MGARLRTFLTTLGIVIGVSTVIAIVAIIQGLDRSFEEQIQFLGAHTLYVDRAALDPERRHLVDVPEPQEDHGRRS